MYIANGLTVKTMNVVGTAGWKNVPEGAEKNCSVFYVLQLRVP